MMCAISSVKPDVLHTSLLTLITESNQK